MNLGNNFNNNSYKYSYVFLPITTILSDSNDIINIILMKLINLFNNNF
jgi:hypothetical protein